MSAKKTKTTQRPLGFLESFKEVVTGVGTSIKDDLAKPALPESWAQFIGLDDHGGGHDAHGGGHDAHAGGHGDHGGHDGGGHDSHGGGHGAHGESHSGHGSAHASESHGEHHAEKITTFSGVLEPGKWLNLAHIIGESNEHAPAEAPMSKNVAPGIDYHRDIATVSESANRRKDAQMERRFKEIKEELNRMVESSNQIIQEEFGAITVEQAPHDVGDYHINFLDWMLIVIRNARQKVEDSGAWLASMKGKKGKKNGGALLDAQKKGNTSVSMSNERQVATQTG